MRYKIYTAQHQLIYDELHTVPISKKNELIISKEHNYLMNKYKTIREDFITLGKVKNIDCLFSDVFIGKKDKVYIYEHIILKSDMVLILERENSYGNQEKLIKEKMAYLNKLWGDVLKLDYLIISEETNLKSKKRTMGDALLYLERLPGKDRYSDSVKEFILKKHLALSVKEFIKLKHNINIAEVQKEKIKRKSSRVKVPRNVLPEFFKIQTNISFLSSAIMLLYGLCALFSTVRVLKVGDFKFAIVLDLLYGCFLYKILSLIEVTLGKKTKILMLLTILLIFGVFLYKIIYLL